jgi:restriction system protein
MSIPDYQTVMLPLLKLIAVHGPMNRSDAVRLIADEFKLSEAQRRELFPKRMHANGMTAMSCVAA